MLLANISVSEKIFSIFPAISVLRKHSTPKPQAIKDLAQILKKFGFQLDYASNKTLAESLDRI
jgi:exosome complex exonuclease DIS3/RRP44